MKRLFIISVVAAMLAASALAQDDRIGVRQWKLVQLDGGNVPSTSNAYLQLEAGHQRFSGNTGCNRMFGAVSVNRNRIDFANVGTTRMACADPRTRRLESVFTRLLGNVDNFRQRGNSLELYVRRRLVMKFQAPSKQSPVEPDDTATLENRKWVLDTIRGAAVSDTGPKAFVIFDPQKRSAGGDSSCNVFGGSYSATGSNLKIIDVVATMRACIEDDRMRIEREFLDGLRATNRYEIQNNRLTLYQGRRALLVFVGEGK